MNISMPDQRPNYEGFVVIGAGLPRTGTTSLRDALGQLLDGKCYHMKTILANSDKKSETDIWIRAVDGKVTNQEWKQFLQGRGFRAGVDFPIAMFYKQLMEAFPEAKVVLSVRDPEGWYKSFRDTIYQFYAKDLAMTILNKLLFSNSEDFERVVNRKPDNVDQGLISAVSGGRDSSVRFFNQWVAEVKRVVPKGQLLVFEAKQGWKPLCEFTLTIL